MEFSLISLFVVLLVAWLAGELASRLGYPSILGELAAGILFGPAVLGHITRFHLHSDPALSVLAQLGVFFMMLYIGIEIDHRELWGASWAGLLAAVGGFFVPVVAGYVAASFFPEINLAERLFLSIALGVTALVVNSRILVDLKLLGTRVGNVLVAAALISDTAAIVIFSGMLGIMTGGELHWGTLAGILGKAIAFFGVAIAIGLFAFPYVGRRLMRAGFTERTANFTLVLLVGLVFAEMAERAGLHAILGAFLAGLFLREEVLMRKLSQDISGLVHDLSIGFLAPIFFVTVGFDVSLSVFRDELPLLITIIVVATVGKVLGTVLCYLPTGHGWREALVVGAGMNGRGAVEIIFAGIGLKMKLIRPETFSILVFMAFITTATVPLLLKWGTIWLRRRNELVRSDEQRKGVIIVGAGPLARLIARELSNGEPVRLIDTNEHNCTLARKEGLTVVHGNALNENTLSLADPRRARMFLTLTSNAEVNRFSAQLARNSFGIPEIYTPAGKRDGDRSLARLLAETQQPPLFGGAVTLGDWNRWIARKEVRRTRLAVANTVSPADFFREVAAEGDVLPLLAVHQGQAALFNTVPMLETGDEVVLLRRRSGGEEWEERFQELVRNCPVLDLKQTVSVDEFFRLAAEELAERVHAPMAEITHLLLEREREVSTVLIPGIAIPHVRLQGQGVFELLMARGREGVQFTAEGPPVGIIFLLASTRDERNSHLRALATIGQALQEPDFEAKWMAASGADDLRRVMLGAMRRKQ